MRRAGIGEVPMIADARAESPRILIVFPQRRPPTSSLHLHAALIRLGALARLKSFWELSCEEVKYYDLIVLRGLPYHLSATEVEALSTCLKRNAKAIINDPFATLLARDKYTSSKVLEDAGIPTPRTELVRSRSELLKLVREMENVVVKPLSGSLGVGIKRLNADNVYYFVTSLPFEFTMIVQEYIDKARDVRVLVVGNEAIGAMYRISPTEVASNIARGGEPDPAPLDAYAKVAIRAVKALGLEYGGVDLVETPEGPKVLEVNPSPLWRGLSECLKKDITLLLANFFIKRASEVKTGSEG